jgi:hypothetical protein
MLPTRSIAATAKLAAQAGSDNPLDLEKNFYVLQPVRTTRDSADSSLQQPYLIKIRITFDCDSTSSL